MSEEVVAVTEPNHLHRPLRSALCMLLLGLSIFASAHAAPQSAYLQRIDDALDDDPIAVLRDAEQALHGDMTRLPPADRLDAAVRLAAAGNLLEDAKAAKRGVDAGVPLARELHDDGAMCLLKYAQASIALANDERPDSIVAQLGEAIAAAKASGIDWCAARLRLAQGEIYGRAGRGAEAMAATIDAHRQFELQNDKMNMAKAREGMCWLYRQEGDNPRSLQRAIESCQAAVAAFDPVHQRSYSVLANQSLASAYFAAKLLPQAREHANVAFRLATSIGDQLGSAYNSLLYGKIEMAAGRPVQALTQFDRAMEIFGRADLPGMQLRASTARVGALTALRRHGEAQQELAAADALRKRENNTDTDVSYERAALDFYETFGDLARALQASKALDAANQLRVVEENRKAASALQERFETERKEAENKLLREQQRTADSQRWLLLTTLALSLVLLVAMGFYLFQQMHQRRRMAELAARDDLTGMPNRRSILETARQVNVERRRLQQSACIAVLDIDHFKRVNDTYGHDVGDAALITFARICSQRLRGRDRLGRFGGEEFLLVLPGACVADLPGIFDRLRAGVHAAAVPGMPPEVRLTFSMGCALFEAEDEIEQTIHRADQALYRAKQAGRDRLEVAE